MPSIPCQKWIKGNQPASLLGPPPSYMNSSIGQDMSQNTMHMQMEEKQRVFTGIVTSLHDYFGIVDEEVFFQLSVVKGRMPKVGEKVLVKAVYNPSQSVQWNAVKIQALSSQPLLKSPTPSLLHMASLGPKQGILGAKPQMLFQQQPHRIPSLLSQKPVSLFQTVPHPQIGRPGRFPNQAKGRFNQEIGRWDDLQRGADFDSKKRKQRIVSQQGTVKKPRHERPFYRVPFARHGVSSPFCDTIEIMRRYRNIVIPKDFFDVQLSWLDSFPLSQPLSLKYPCRFQLTEGCEVAPETEDVGTSDQPPSDSDTAFSAKVLLISSPGIEEFYHTCLQFIEDPNSWIENLEHPSKQIQFLLGRKGDEAVPIGGAWSPSLDGPDPETDPLTLVRTAIRCTKALTGIDLSRCTSWLRFAELRYLRPGPSPGVEKVVVFLPDVWSCVPSLVEWEALTQPKPTDLELMPPLPPSPAVKPPLPPSPPPNEDEPVKLVKVAPESVNTSPPVEPAIIIRSTRTFKCTTVSLYAMSEFRKQKEKLSFESAVLAELFQEMLQRDFGYKIYRGLLNLPEVPEPGDTEGKKNVEPEKTAESEKEVEIETPDVLQETQNMAAEAGDRKSLQQEVGDSVDLSHKPSSISSAAQQTDQKDNCKQSADEISLHVDEDMLLLEDQDVFACKLEDSDQRSNASVHSDMDVSHHDLDKDSTTTALLPLESLLGFLYFDQNFCGYIQRRDAEKILLTLGLHLTTDQVRLLVNKVAPRFVCNYRTLKYCREEGMDGTNSEQSVENNFFITGNLGLLNMGTEMSVKQCSAAPEGDLVPYNGTVVNIRNMLERMEHTENGRLQLESKIHSLECKMADSQVRVTSVELENKTVTSEMQALQKRLAEMEQQLKSAENQKYAIQRQLQENNRRLNPLRVELQKIIEKTNYCLNPKQQKDVKDKEVSSTQKDVDVTDEDTKEAQPINETD
ncbi:cell cycle and apoptosis regulator protein 2 isoform X2 [Pleurodeles waltl]|uniref:cell cycle and apoptosis regulator protein 2 isoform X2 n=1 Tax=Pleurodeles waltl TaxID=8319 RepID=UPI00370991D0